MATRTAIAELHRAAPADVASAGTDDLAVRIADAGRSQRAWSQRSVRDRLRVVRRIRHLLVERSSELIASVTFPHRNGAAETLAAELVPLADACRFLEKEARAILAPRRLRRRSRPIWLRGVDVQLRREPLGTVLIVGAANYPLFLPGVHALQALAAGNAVLIKPGRGSAMAAQALADTCVLAGVDASLVQVLPEEPRWVESAIEAGVNKVVLTGSAETGRNVQSLLSQTLTPSVMELSGCDAVFVLESASLERVAQCLAFGLRFNGSATCIAPRRVFVPRTIRAELEQRLLAQVAGAESESIAYRDDRVADLVSDATRRGARVIAGGITGSRDEPRILAPTILADAQPEMDLLKSDVFRPVLSIVPVASIAAALHADRQCPYALGAVVFGEGREAQHTAEQIDAGCVVINDLIAPTADPRVPFGGRGQSGFGLTRGAAGLEEMTQIKAVVRQKSRWLPHLDEVTPMDAQLLSGFLGLCHGRGLRERLRGAWTALRAATEQRKWKTTPGNRRPTSGNQP